MPSTALSICNSALIKLGAKTITTFTDDRKEAELCSARYPLIRDNLLRGHTWAFAKRAISLTPDDVSDLPSWEQMFSAPSSVARIISIKDADDNTIEYELINGHIYADESSIIVRYVMKYDDVDDGVEFPSDFGEALASMLAADICISLTQTQALRQTYMDEFSYALSMARFNGAVERSDEVIIAEDWTGSRSLPLVDDRSVRNLAN